MSEREDWFKIELLQEKSIKLTVTYNDWDMLATFRPFSVPYCRECYEAVIPEKINSDGLHEKSWIYKDLPSGIYNIQFLEWSGGNDNNWKYNWKIEKYNDENKSEEQEVQKNIPSN